jgi:hypothetical protein
VGIGVLVTKMICACINLLYCLKKKGTVAAVIYLVVQCKEALCHYFMLSGDKCKTQVDEHQNNLLFIYTDVQ